MERINRKGFGFCLISHKSSQTHRIINRSTSVSSVRSVVSSAGFGLIKAINENSLPFSALVMAKKESGFSFDIQSFQGGPDRKQTNSNHI